MKLLLINWAWYPTGGDWTYINNIQTLYEKNGYEVIPLSTINEKNVETKPPAYFINAPNYKQLNKHKNIITGIQAVKNSIISCDAIKVIDAIIKKHDIKIAHLNNIHHYITPAIIWKLKKAGVKIIWTMHDYKIICPDSLFISNGKICEKCIGGNFYQCSLNKCKKDSFSASLLASIEAYIYHKSKIYDKVDAYLCPSLFLKNKFKQFGFSDEKLHIVNSCYDISIIDKFIEDKALLDGSQNTNTNEEYILYIGRIEEIKGIRTLINAIKNSNIKLKIVGSGSIKDELILLAQKENINNIDFLGFMDKRSVFELTYNSKFVICPSECYENFPFSIIESFLLSKAVIGSYIGGIPELIINGETGYLFEARNIEDLKEKITILWNNIDLTRKMGIQARKHIFNMVNFDNHWRIIQTIINNIPNNDN